MNKPIQPGTNPKIRLHPYTLRLALYLQRLMDNGFQGNVLIPIKGKQFGLIKKEEFIDLRPQEPPNK
jgi:hypothetical protein